MRLAHFGPKRQPAKTSIRVNTGIFVARFDPNIQTPNGFGVSDRHDLHFALCFFRFSLWLLIPPARHPSPAPRLPLHLPPSRMGIPLLPLLPAAPVLPIFWILPIVGPMSSSGESKDPADPRKDSHGHETRSLSVFRHGRPGHSQRLHHRPGLLPTALRPVGVRLRAARLSALRTRPWRSGSNEPGPATGAITYPYYTLHGPRDFYTHTVADRPVTTPSGHAAG